MATPATKQQSELSALVHILLISCWRREGVDMETEDVSKYTPPLSFVHLLLKFK
jgi:hypothetical protein